MTDQTPAPSPRLITFASVGWVLLLMAVLCAALLAWALGPALLRLTARPPGDGKTIQSFGFDLAALQVPAEFVVPAMLHRDMIPVMTAPTHSRPDDTGGKASRWKAMQETNDPKYGKYLVPTDKVIGLVVNGEARAYPLSVMYVHELINDTLGGVPLAVTHHWPCDSAVAFERTIDGKPVEFAVSGLVYNSNALYYDRPASGINADDPPQSLPLASLWCQLSASAISGPHAGTQLTRLPLEVTSWAAWSERHPQTTVLNRDPSFAKRYKDAAPTSYFLSDEVKFPFSRTPRADAPPDKARVLVIETGTWTAAFPIDWLAQRAATASDGRTCSLDFRGSSLHFTVDRELQTATVVVDTTTDDRSAPLATPCFWFAAQAIWPDVSLPSN